MTSMPSPSTEMWRRVGAHIAAGESFAIVRRPDGAAQIVDAPLDTDAPTPEGPYFRISPWDEGSRHYLPTSREDYAARLGALIRSFGPNLRKVVFSRTTCGRIAPDTIVEKARKYFVRFPEALCFLYYTPATGFWLGASPELLLKSENGGRFSTMALAGTRLADGDGPWDKKNSEEHAYVVDFIETAFRDAGLIPETDDRATLRFGRIEHLCTRISAKGDDSAFRNLLERLDPTPALCGTPRDAAREAISRFEAHKRGCYGGYIEFRMPRSETREAYVNLRCARIDRDGHWCVFSGGGIIESSVVDDEWLESERKAEALVSILEDRQ